MPAQRGERPASPLLACAAAAREELLVSWDTTSSGLTESEAARRLAADGPNEIATRSVAPWPVRLARTCWNPLVILLGVLAGTSLATGDRRAAAVIAIMIVLGVALRFAQETHAGAAAARLHAMVRVTTTVVRDGQPREVPRARWCAVT
jgi:Mg2+-importing ATPase